MDFMPISVFPSMHFKYQEYMNITGCLSLSLLDGNTAPTGLDTTSQKVQKNKEEMGKISQVNNNRVSSYQDTLFHCLADIY